mgnify:CR=1 FL=1
MGGGPVVGRASGALGVLCLQHCMHRACTTAPGGIATTQLNHCSRPRLDPAQPVPACAQYRFMEQEDTSAPSDPPAGHISLADGQL